MNNQKANPPQHQHSGEGGRKFQEQGQKGHDLLNTDSNTAGVGSHIDSPQDAKRADTGIADQGEEANDQSSDERSDR